MNNTVKLLKVALIMAFRGDVTKKKQKFKKPLIGLFILIAFLPMVSTFVLLSKELYTALELIGQGNVVIALSLAGGSLVVLLFGMFYTISSYYLAKDIPHYLALPLKPEEIIASRFLTTLLYEYLTLIIFVGPVIIGCGIAGGFGVVYYLASLLVFIFLPILPLSISSIVIVSIMSFSKKAINKDRFTLISGLLGLGIGLGLNFYLQSFFVRLESKEAIEQMMSDGSLNLVNQIASYFPGIKNATLAITNGQFFQLLIFIVIAIVAFLLFMIVAKILYFRGVLGISQQVAKRDYKLSSASFKKSENNILAYTIKELKLIFRTPIYFMNLALMDYLMPLIFIIAFVSTGDLDTLVNAAIKYTSQLSSAGLLIGISFAFFAFISGMNGITATCISREGEQLYIMKYLPMTIDNQIKAKLLSGLIVSLLGMIITLLVITVILQINILILILLLIAGANSVLLTRLTGLLIDLSHPKLNWDNEVKAAKQNMNLMFNMLLSMVIAALAAVGTFMFQFSIGLSIIIFIVGFALVNYGLYQLICKSAYRKIMKIE
ncbi:MAG: hypothetical protein KAG94_04330 [Clostridiales bacterium]|nr:hypothetical protein [Clostridiales bacterium]